MAVLEQRNFISESLIIELLKAIFKYYCKEQTYDQTYFIKVASNGARIVPLIKRAMPQVKHMFTFRRNTRKIMSSAEKVKRGPTAGDLQVYLWNLYPPLAYEINNADYEYEMYKRFGFKDVLDMAIICHVSSWYYYCKNKHIFDIPLIYYEDLIADKEKTLRTVFELCEIPYDRYIDVALKEFENDSQAGTALSQDKMKFVQDTQLNEEKIMKINDMCDHLNIPRVDI